ncbi:MAG: radical SAM family heme chaperone HemW [Butyrivibrio sp.]|nr:radical SAM family heme chaperone HemW [Butyrivibrio sp.]
MSKELSLYIHIPFCVRKCLYCDFLSFNADNSLIDSYFEALMREIRLASKDYKDYEVISIFFGGGTPSFVKETHICRIMDAVKENFCLRDDAEISIEANPASAIYDKLLAYRKSGINRISIGAQSLNDEELTSLGRVHDSKAFYETFDNARKAGFANVNVDVMSALPSQSLLSYLETLKKVVDLKPEHISAYSLIVEEGTPFYDMDLNLPDEDTDRQMYHETKALLKEHGYHRYEISNYALDGNSALMRGTNSTKDLNDGEYEAYECRHNKVYWRRGNYLGLGLGAASMVANTRWSNIRSINDYIRLLTVPSVTSDNDNTSAFLIRENVEKLSKQSQMEEFMFLGLRLVKGVSITEFSKLFNVGIETVYGEVISKYTNLGLLENSKDGQYLRLTESGLDVSNTVMAEFLL